MKSLRASSRTEGKGKRQSAAKSTDRIRMIQRAGKEDDKRDRVSFMRMKRRITGSRAGQEVVAVRARKRVERRGKGVGDMVVHETRYA